LRMRRPGRTRELASRADSLALEPARLVREGGRVFPPPPAPDDPDRRARRGVAARAPAGRGGVARAGARGEARPADDDRLPDDLERALLRRRPPGCDLVREGRPLVD